MPDNELSRHLNSAQDIKVELTLRDALKLYQVQGPDVCEIFSQPTICAEAPVKAYRGQELVPGWSLDLTMNDPQTGQPWDLSMLSVQNRLRKLVASGKPFVLIGSPPCTAFSPLQNISRHKRDPSVVKGELRRAKAHIRFCLEMYQLQTKGNRYFIHEHPMKSAAWKMEEMVAFCAKPEVQSVRVDMCAFGLSATDKEGTGLVEKATRIMSNADAVLERIERRCSNAAGTQAKHRHVHLISGKAKAAQVYPRALCQCICEGVAAQKKMDRLGVKSVPLMSMEVMEEVVDVSGVEKSDKNVSPSEALHEEAVVAFDDVSGEELQPELVKQARKDEITYFRSMGVYDKVPMTECRERTGKAPIAVRWVDVNKGDNEKPNYRSRLVAKEFKTDVRPDLYAATPPSECLRLMLSKLASTPGATLMYADVSRAYFYAPAVRPVYVKIADEDREAGDEEKCGRLKMSMYGTRDAALNWSKEYGDTLRAAGYVQGKHNPCLFFHKVKQVAIMVHGDDFVAVGSDVQLAGLRKTLEDK